MTIRVRFVALLLGLWSGVAMAQSRPNVLPSEGS